MPYKVYYFYNFKKKIWAKNPNILDKVKKILEVKPEFSFANITRATICLN